MPMLVAPMARRVMIRSSGCPTPSWAAIVLQSPDIFGGSWLDGGRQSDLFESESRSKPLAQSIHDEQDPLGREFFLPQRGEPIYTLGQAGEDGL